MNKEIDNHSHVVNNSGAEVALIRNGEVVTTWVN